MKFKEGILSSSMGAVLLALAIGAQPLVAVAQAPKLTIQSEEAAHPKLVVAIREMKNALYELSHTKDDYGGYRDAAIRDIRNAIFSMQKALYFRLNMDDEALRKIQ
jgi:hypothetical protein